MLLLLGSTKYFSTDLKHYVNNKYEFQPHNLAHYHQETFLEFIEVARTRNYPVLIVDNTNITVAEFAPYYRVAEAYGYETTLVHVYSDVGIEELVKRNTHGVPYKTIADMSSRWENHKFFKQEVVVNEWVKE
jgi:predicted kinase